MVVLVGRCRLTPRTGQIVHELVAEGCVLELGSFLREYLKHVCLLSLSLKVKRQERKIGGFPAVHLFDDRDLTSGGGVGQELIYLGLVMIEPPA